MIIYNKMSNNKNKKKIKIESHRQYIKINKYVYNFISKQNI